jgi:hypothetical protein
LTNFPGRQWYGYVGSYSPSYWSPWKTQLSSFQYLGPIRRVTFIPMLALDSTGAKGAIAAAQNNPADIAARLAAAEQLCSASDELAIELPSTDDQPALQSWRTSGGVALSRQNVGNFSWFVTVAPTSAEARNNVNLEGYSYDVSVVVCYKRDFSIRPQMNPSSGTPVASRNWSPSEVLVNAAIRSTGPSGGELLLTSSQDDNGVEDIRTGSWVMLCGPHPNSTPIPSPVPTAQFNPTFFFAWYQVQAVDTEIASSDPGYIAGARQRYVTLRGPEWPWQTSQSFADPNTQLARLSNDLCVGIVPSAVAVHTKTMRLQSAPR